MMVVTVVVIFVPGIAKLGYFVYQFTQESRVRGLRAPHGRQPARQLEVENPYRSTDGRLARESIVSPRFLNVKIAG